MLTTRPAEPRDVDAAARLARDAYRPCTARIGRPPAPVEADHAAAVHAATMWVAEGDGRLLGLLVLLDAEDEAVRRGHGRIRLYTDVARGVLASRPAAATSCGRRLLLPPDAG